MAGRNSESIPLEKLEAQLEEELARGGDNFEAFGLKLPGGQVTSFGIVVLLSAQLYLLLYLRQLGGNLTSADDGWNVPWMALEGSWLGQSMYAISLVVCSARSLPVAVWSATSCVWLASELAGLDRLSSSHIAERGVGSGVLDLSPPERGSTAGTCPLADVQVEDYVMFLQQFFPFDTQLAKLSPFFLLFVPQNGRDSV